MFKFSLFAQFQMASIIIIIIIILASSSLLWELMVFHLSFSNWKLPQVSKSFSVFGPISTILSFRLSWFVIQFQSLFHAFFSL